MNLPQNPSIFKMSKETVLSSQDFKTFRGASVLQFEFYLTKMIKVNDFWHFKRSENDKRGYSSNPKEQRGVLQKYYGGLAWWFQALTLELRMVDWKSRILCSGGPHRETLPPQPYFCLCSQKGGRIINSFCWGQVSKDFWVYL